MQPNFFCSWGPLYAFFYWSAGLITELYRNAQFKVLFLLRFAGIEGQSIKLFRFSLHHSIFEKNCLVLSLTIIHHWIYFASILLLLKYLDFCVIYWNLIRQIWSCFKTALHMSFGFLFGLLLLNLWICMKFKVASPPYKLLGTDEPRSNGIIQSSKSNRKENDINRPVAQNRLGCLLKRKFEHISWKLHFHKLFI